MCVLLHNIHINQGSSHISVGTTIIKNNWLKLFKIKKKYWSNFERSDYMTSDYHVSLDFLRNKSYLYRNKVYIHFIHIKMFVTFTYYDNNTYSPLSNNTIYLDYENSSIIRCSFLFQ